MKIEKLKESIVQIGLFILIILCVGVVYYHSWITGGELTTGVSCSTEYINGNIGVKQLRNECPNLSKKTLIDNINVDKNISDRDRSELLRDIEGNF